MTKLMRPNQIYGRGNPIPVGRTNFYENIVLQDERDPCIPGTDIPRLKLTKISDRVSVGFEDEVAELAEALRARRDRKLNQVA